MCPSVPPHGQGGTRSARITPQASWPRPPTDKTEAVSAPANPTRPRSAPCWPCRPEPLAPQPPSSRPTPSPPGRPWPQRPATATATATGPRVLPPGPCDLVSKRSHVTDKEKNPCWWGQRSQSAVSHGREGRRGRRPGNRGRPPTRTRRAASTRESGSWVSAGQAGLRRVLASLRAAGRWAQGRCPAQVDPHTARGCLNTFLRRTEYYLVLRRREILTPVKPWRSLEDIVSSETSRSQRGECGVTPRVRGLWDHQVHRSRARVSAGVGGRGVS